MDIGIIANIITIILTVTAAGFIYGRNPRSNVTRSFLVLILLFVVWTLSHLVLYVSQQRTLIIVEQLSYILGLCIAWAFVGFCYFFPSQSHLLKKSTILLGVILTFVLVIFVLIPTGIITGKYLTPGGPLALKVIFFSFYALVITYIFACAYYLLNKKSKNLGGETKILIRYIVVYSLLPVVIAGVLNIIFLNFLSSHYLIYGPVFTLIFTFGVAYILIRSERP